MTQVKKRPANADRPTKLSCPLRLDEPVQEEFGLQPGVLQVDKEGRWSYTTSTKGGYCWGLHVSYLYKVTYLGHKGTTRPRVCLFLYLTPARDAHLRLDVGEVLRSTRPADA